MSQQQRHYQVIVVGGGHAGTEAALAAARMGCRTLLLTQNMDTLGQTSCNPAVGGIGKSHLVREVDALDGAMAVAVDHSGIQFRVLNRSKGPAVRATRAQVDRQLYRKAIRLQLENQPGLWIFQQEVQDLLLKGEQVIGVRTPVADWLATTVVLTAGTFLNGKIHVGKKNHGGGRAGDPASTLLADRLRELPLREGRLKTGTPPRLDVRSVDFRRMTAQPGDEPVPVMSFLGDRDQHPRQRDCHITATNPLTHEIIRASLDRSPMYDGTIEGVGPRYCPSIEDKVVRFADRDSHQIFIEPEGLHSGELYPNGLSTSLPFEVQLELVRTIRGLEKAHLVRPGYAIEYDFFDPRDLSAGLESKFIRNLFLAGQVNGTTGYEEAAAQGLLAGANAALRVQEREPWSPGRHEAYLGVLVDDLVTAGTLEPYRMFTSRAEHRLALREDNADLRLTETGRRLGLVGERRWAAFCQFRDQVESERRRLSGEWLQPLSEAAGRLQEAGISVPARECRLLELLRQPQIGYAQLRAAGLGTATGRVAQQIEFDARYAGYIERQEREIARRRRYENATLPVALDYSQVKGLSTEVHQRLSQARPRTLGQASRLPGITPAAISLLLIHLAKHRLLESDAA